MIGRSLIKLPTARRIGEFTVLREVNDSFLFDDNPRNKASYRAPDRHGAEFVASFATRGALPGQRILCFLFELSSAEVYMDLSNEKCEIDRSENSVIFLLTNFVPWANKCYKCSLLSSSGMLQVVTEN